MKAARHHGGRAGREDTSSTCKVVRDVCHGRGRQGPRSRTANPARADLRPAAWRAALTVTEEKELRAIEAAALLHDMGKAGDPRAHPHKPGKADARQYER